MHLTFCDMDDDKKYVYVYERLEYIQNSHSHSHGLLLFYLFANNKIRVNYFLWLGCANIHKDSKKKHSTLLESRPANTKLALDGGTRKFVSKQNMKIKYQAHILRILLHRFREHISQQ